MESLQAHLTDSDTEGIPVGTYFVWQGKLWYVLEADEKTALLENCKNLKAQIMKISLFKDDMKEVKI